MQIYARDDSQWLNIHTSQNIHIVYMHRSQGDISRLLHITITIFFNMFFSILSHLFGNEEKTKLRNYTWFRLESNAFEFVNR